jgi:predicted short-subunit dehydrogenase-like oxidoreductase (DUF2520 family)
MTDRGGPPTVRVLGRGRAGGSFEHALRAAGWTVETMGRGGPLAGAATGVDLLLLCVPDAAIAEVAGQVEPVASTVVAHASGATGLGVLGSHQRTASVHPLVSLPDPSVGASRLRGAWFAVAGDPWIRTVVDTLGGTSVEVPDAARVRYHAAAVIASNHLVALMGQVQRVAAGAGVPLDAFLELARGSLDNVAALGPVAALTGPVARGDMETVRAHLAALDPAERPAYLELARAAGRLVGIDVPVGPEPNGS